jgi:hypothetical protein
MTQITRWIALPALALSLVAVAYAAAPAKEGAGQAANGAKAGSEAAADGNRAFGQCSRKEADTNADCRNAPKPVAKTPKELAPVDLTGTWTAVVTEDWRWRMMMPPKGDYASVPLSAEGKRRADTWDPNKAPNSCLPYGAAGLMRNPMRVRFSWVDDKTLKVETDHGEVTRLFHFDSSQAPSDSSAQGSSVAAWDQSGLKVVTTHLTPGYLRKNGVQYSENTLLTEYYDRYSAFGDDWFSVTTVVHDPENLSREFITSSHFKRLADQKAWHPEPCGPG